MKETKKGQKQRTKERWTDRNKERKEGRKKEIREDDMKERKTLRKHEGKHERKRTAQVTGREFMHSLQICRLVSSHTFCQEPQVHLLSLFFAAFDLTPGGTDG